MELAARITSLSPSRHYTAGTVGLLVLAMACTGTERAPPRDTSRAPAAVPPAEVSLIDSTYPLAVAGSGGWNFQQSASRDLNADGTPERVVLTARVEMMRGRPLWDDGQPWLVYVETADGKRTYMYSRYVQLGTLTMRITEPDSGTSPRIVILEQLPDRLAVYEGEYRGVGQLRVSASYERMLDPRGDIASPTLP